MGLYRKPQRLRHYDYSSQGWYFITICTQYMVEWFGEVINGRMELNACGEIVKQQLLWLPQQYPYIQLDEWVVMPNHVHVIFVLNTIPGHCRDNPRVVPTGRMYLYRRQHNVLSNMISAFKTTSSKRIHRETTDQPFLWQRSFYDHIIRDETALSTIRRYIRHNPKQW